MKKKLKIAAAALVLAVTASTSFAADLTGLSSADFLGAATIQELIGAGEALITSDTDANVALILQIGETGNHAYIEQTGGPANFAVIMQEGSTVVGAAAAIYQSGSLNHAAIYQH